MSLDLRSIVEQIHASGWRAALAITGGGSAAIAELLRVPGAARTLVEAVVPYDLAALTEFLGREPVHACSTETAIAMAERARWRASRLHRDAESVLGLGVTASLVSDRPKHGDHRCHIAVACEGHADIVSMVLEKGRRDRAAEEELVAHAAVLVLARSGGIAVPAVASLLGPNDRLAEERVESHDPLSRLLAGSIGRLSVLPDGQFSTEPPRARGVLAGAFNPLHAGHLGLAPIAAELLGGPVAFELSVLNVDKPPLRAAEVRRRLSQFTWRSSVELTRAATFREKSRLLPGVTFIVGADTAERIVDPKYYAGSETEMLAALEEIAAAGCHVLVAGRLDARGRFQTMADVAVPARFAHLFREIPAAQFRIDVSSTELRQPASRAVGVVS